MVIYSHNRLSCFEQCPLKYRMRYIDKIESPIDNTIENFLGIKVHQVLEKLYLDINNNNKVQLNDFLTYLDKIWNETWNEKIKIVKKNHSVDYYRNLAKKYVTNYFIKNIPFNQSEILGIEQNIRIVLDDKGDYILQGIIDRLEKDDLGSFFIHDYKTSSKLPNFEQLKLDRQLALYGIGIQQAYPNSKNIELIWHFLAFNKCMKLRLAEIDIQILKNKIIRLIDKIENTKKYPAKPSILCKWCEYQPICNGRELFKKIIGINETW